METPYRPKTGLVWIRNFDQGIIDRLQSVLISNNYFVNFSSGLSQETSPNVPVIFNNPEQVYDTKIYPCIIVKRDSIEPDMMRWHSYGQLDYFAGVPGTERVVDGKTYYDKVELKPQAWPYNITYSLSCLSRYEYEAQTLLHHVMRWFQPRGVLTVKSSLNQNHYYTFFVEQGLQDIGEYVDVAERLHGYVLSVRVEAEIDLIDPTQLDTVLETRVTVERSDL